MKRTRILQNIKDAKLKWILEHREPHQVQLNASPHSNYYTDPP